MRKILVILIMILLSRIILTSGTFNLDNTSNFTLLKKGVISSNDNVNVDSILKSDKSIIYSFNLTYGISYVGKLFSFKSINGISIGIGQIKHLKKSTKEITYNIHYLKNSYFYVAGIYAQMNSYRNSHRLGFVTILTTGLDYIEGKKIPFCFDPGGSDEGDYDLIKVKGFFPNIAIGSGYSIMLSLNSRMLIYLDLGIKQNISSLNITINF